MQTPHVAIGSCRILAAGPCPSTVNVMTSSATLLPVLSMRLSCATFVTTIWGRR